MSVRYETRTRSRQQPLDTPIHVDGDNGFIALDSHTDPALLNPGTLQQAENLRLDESTGIARGRKGIKRVSANSNLLAEAEIFTTARFQDPAGTDYVCLAADQKAYFVDASDTGSVQTTEVAYQTRDSAVESVSSDSFLMQAYDKMYLFRGEGLRLPFDLDTGSTVVELGKYPLVFDGDLATPGTFKRPESVAITGAAETTPIMITAVNHGYSTGDVVTITDVGGNTNANGTHYVTVTDGDQFTLDGVASNAGYTSDTGLAVSESSELPAADFGLYYRNRLCIPTNRDELKFSDILSESSFPAMNFFKYNVGTSDKIMAILPVMDDGLLILKRHSIMLQTSIGNLANTTITEVTRQMGCVSKKSAVTVGGAVFFLSDSGIYSIDFGIRGQDRVGTPITAMRLSDNPLSKPIHDVIETIDFEAAVKESTAVYFNTRYWIAVPIQGTATAKASKILVYNVNLKSWESVDNLPDYVDDLVVGVYGKALRLFAVCISGKLLVMDENATGNDESGNGGSVSTTAPSLKARTRAYTMKDLGQKRWLYGAAGLAIQASGLNTNFTVDVTTQDPDSTSASHATYNITGTEDKLARFSIKKRAYALDLTFNCPGGQAEVRRVQVEGIRSDNLITTFE